MRGTLTVQRYVEDIFQPHVGPFLNGLPGTIFLQDNARPHTARVAQDFLRPFQTLPWPACSPDLSPVEHVGDQLKRQMPSCHSVHDLELDVQDLGAHLPQDNIRCLINFMPDLFSSIVRDFLELFYNLWRTVLAKNKIVLDPALWLQSFRTPENATIGVRSGVARWIQRLNEYYFDIRHRKGSSHGNADALSRRPCPENCRHCSRVETKYDYAIRQITTSTATPPDPWSDEKVREDQMADPDIKPLIEFMESSSNKPSWQDISAYSPTTKQYWALWNSLHLRNGVLYRKFESEDGKTFRWQLVLPRSRIPDVLKELHGSPTGGHFGVVKTLHRVRERFCWGKVRADVEQWCKSCDACSARKGPKIRSRGKLHRYNVGASFERIAFDILGPLPRTASGNKYLLVVMDYFTKWPEVYPIPDQEAPTVAEAVVQHWISRYGYLFNFIPIREEISSLWY
ncbi:retrovirus-related Pol polyprotein from transposon 412 [Trichonephila clavipes]|nr:retrovirus-related Pol polyprotein from transposon 412 [Trichonephila clavipes]